MYLEPDGCRDALADGHAVLPAEPLHPRGGDLGMGLCRARARRSLARRPDRGARHLRRPSQELVADKVDDRRMAHAARVT